jgi:hypothetical protein
VTDIFLIAGAQAPKDIILRNTAQAPDPPFQPRPSRQIFSPPDDSDVPLWRPSRNVALLAPTAAQNPFFNPQPRAYADDDPAQWKAPLNLALLTAPVPPKPPILVLPIRGVEDSDVGRWMPQRNVALLAPGVQNPFFNPVWRAYSDDDPPARPLAPNLVIGQAPFTNRRRPQFDDSDAWQWTPRRNAALLAPAAQNPFFNPQPRTSADDDPQRPILVRNLPLLTAAVPPKPPILVLSARSVDDTDPWQWQPRLNLALLAPPAPVVVVTPPAGGGKRRRTHNLRWSDLSEVEQALIAAVLAD